jgi:hypothetical protein
MMKKIILAILLVISILLIIIINNHLAEERKWTCPEEHRMKSGACALYNLGCDHSNPPCEASYVCVNNTCVSKWSVDSSQVTPEENGKSTTDTTTSNEITTEDILNETESCLGNSYSTIGDITEACVDGVMTTTCTNEGEVYTESEFFKSKIVCEGGIWVNKPLN